MVSVHRGQRNERVEQPRLLLVEGNDDYWFFQNLINRRRSTGIQVIQFSQRAKLGDFLANAIVPDSRFSELVKVVGVVIDADRSYESAFQSVQDSLRRANLPAPAAPLTYGDGILGDTAIKVVAYIMPDNRSVGDLETLCLMAVSDAPAMPCVERYFECLRSINHVPRQESKARIRAFLSANQSDPNLLIGQAISAGALPWDSSAFSQVHQFLDMLDAVA